VTKDGSTSADDILATVQALIERMGAEHAASNGGTPNRDMMPRRAARISEETQAEIVRLALHQMSQTEIARKTGVHRQTVKRVLKRTRAALQINQDLEQDRAEALAVLREVQRAAWAAIDEGRTPARLLAEVRQAQQQINALLGLAPLSPDDPATQLQEFKLLVVGLIRREAPELAPVLAERLRAMNDRLSLEDKARG
jgi:transposase-like protein